MEEEEASKVEDNPEEASREEALAEEEVLPKSSIISTTKRMSVMQAPSRQHLLMEHPKIGTVMPMKATTMTCTIEEDMAIITDNQQTQQENVLQSSQFKILSIENSRLGQQQATLSP